MWKPDYSNLEELLAHLADEIAYTSATGFSFGGVVSGDSFPDAFQRLGEPEIYNTESDQQQTAVYNAAIDHPAHGKRDHHRLNLLLWAFEREPISIIKLHFYYYSTGEDVKLFNSALNTFLNVIIEKLGPPALKKLTTGKQELLYKIGRSKLHIWNNLEGVRIEIK